MEDYMLPCLNKKLFGIECMGCGLQRSILLISEGDFVAAFNMYPPIYTTLLFFIVVGLHFIDKSRNYLKIIVSLAIVNAIVMVVAYVIKMHIIN
jgi:hypothetical protein